MAPVERGARIVAAATAEPAYSYTPREILDHLARVWAKVPRWGLMQRFVENSLIQKRYLAYPPEHLLSPRSLEAKGEEFSQAASDLGERAVRTCLAQADLRPDAVDVFISITSTEFRTPSIDVQLVERLGLRPTVRRLPLSGLACASGAVSISRAYDYIQAHPGSTVLILSVELASLTFQPLDETISNLVSTAIFGDGAAAVLVSDALPLPGPEVRHTYSYLFPGTSGQMALTLKEDGYHVTLGKDVPKIIGRQVKQLVEAACREARWDPAPFDFYCLHPGGARVLEALERALHLGPDQTRWSHDVLARYGNLSSATILYILKEALQEGSLSPGDRGLLAGFGPGFSAEFALLEWAEG